MKVAVISDIHGNIHALSSVLANIEREHVDFTICAGDAVNPFPGSNQVWQTLKDRQIPIIRGNHEDYMLAYYQNDPDHAIRSSIQFMPVQAAARQLRPSIVKEISALPLTHQISGTGDASLLVCHASPTQTNKSFCTGIDSDMAAELHNTQAAAIVGGHIHVQWQKRWFDKLLVVTGSVGLPLGSGPNAQYAILTQQNQSWQVTHKSVRYNHLQALHDLEKSNFLTEGGPMALLMFDELWTAEYRLVPFLRKFCPNPQSMSPTDWQLWVRRYLEAIGRWDALKTYAKNCWVHFNTPTAALAV